MNNDISIEEYIENLGIRMEDGTGYFTGDDFREAIVGVSQNGNIIYSYSKMIESYMKSNNCSEEEAVDWIDYNTLRTIPYMGDIKPIILYEVVN